MTAHTAEQSERDEALSRFKEDWRRVIYDATGDNVKALRAVELAELNGLFDPFKSAWLCQTCSTPIGRDCPNCQRLWAS